MAKSKKRRSGGRLKFKGAETAGGKEKIIFSEPDGLPDAKPATKKPADKPNAAGNKQAPKPKPVGSDPAANPFRDGNNPTAKPKLDGERPASKPKPDGKKAVPIADSAADASRDDTPDSLSDIDGDADVGGGMGAAPTPARSGRLKFTKQEKREAKINDQTEKLGRKAGKTEGKADKYAKKRDKYHDKQPNRKKRVNERYFDEKSGKAKTQLRFDKETIPINEAKWNRAKKKSLPRKAVGGAATLGVNKLHTKVYEVEYENAGTQAGHKAELIGESALRGGKRAAGAVYRFARNTPYRREAKFEVKSLKARSKLEYQRALRDNPKLRSNPISRLWQKRNIQKQYKDAIKTAKKSGETTKKVAGAVKKAGESVTKAVRKNPIFMLKAGLLLLIICMMMGLISMCATMFSGGTGMVGASTYAAEDPEMIAAESAYAGMEAALQYELDNYPALHPGNDEYHYDLDSIWHDPYVLISIISAFHEGPWTIAEVQGTLSMLFERQYILTETVTVETRYRTVSSSYTDPDTGETIDDSYEEAYDYYICSVKLENFNLSHLPIYIMGEDALSRYALFMGTLGNRPDLFPVYLYPHASAYEEYGKHDIPQEYLDADPVFAAMIEEAEKYCGMPYIWGGYCPATSFDCSGFVSWILNSCGWDVGRLGAQGLYGICTPVSATDAKPGDLVFFHSTYDAPGITHVGLYVGDSFILHAGSPIGYASIDTSYWQAHLYGFGRP